MLLIFDWDGTLADSREHIVNAMQAAITELKLAEKTDDQCAQMIGLGLLEVARSLYPSLNDDGLNLFASSYSAHFTDMRQHYGGTQFFPGAISTLEALSEQGHSLAVATGKSRRGLNRVLDADNIGYLFSATRAADETASKPSPLMLEEILADTGIPVSQAVMIGDTSYDMEMAANIDMQRIAVSFGMHEVDVLQQYSPSLVIDRLDQLLQWHGLV